MRFTLCKTDTHYEMPLTKSPGGHDLFSVQGKRLQEQNLGDITLDQVIAWPLAKDS